MKRRTIAEQLSAIRSRHPEFIITKNGANQLTIRGEARPTARSVNYTYQLDYILDSNPVVIVLSPTLEKNEKGKDIPHTYSKGELCLHFPAFREFQSCDLLTETIIPWVSLWLYYYETWHTTGKWLGGGIHPVKTITYIKPK